MDQTHGQANNVPKHDLAGYRSLEPLCTRQRSSVRVVSRGEAPRTPVGDQVERALPTDQEVRLVP
jgi:hypothetical protein